MNKKMNPPLGERVSKLEGKVSVMVQLNCAELAILVMILIALLAKA